MPYLKQDEKDTLDKDVLLATTAGHLNYIFTKFYLKIWQASKCYKTVHDLRVMSIHPEINTELHELVHQLGQVGRVKFSRLDLNAALDLAFLEFYRREVSDYENKKIKTNGDVYPERLEVK